MSKQDKTAQTAREALQKVHGLMILAVRTQGNINEATKRIQAIRENEQVPERTSFANKLLTKAKEFAGDETFNLQAFLDWCKEEEKWITSDEAGEHKTNRVPRCWTQAKSNIKKAWEDNQLNPAAYTNVEKLTEDHLEANKKRNEGAPETMTAEQALKKLAKKIDPVFGQMLAAAAGVFESLPEDQKGVMAAAQSALIDRFKTIAHGLGVDTAVRPAQPEGALVAH